MRASRTFVLLFGVASVLSASGHAAEWTSHARRFTGESDRVRQASIKALREDKDLPEKLKRALGTSDHFLALDVISVLRLRSFLPTLLNFAAKDKTGYSYHVINSLITVADLPKISRLYEQRLFSQAASPAAKLALIDALARMRIDLTVNQLMQLYKEDVPEVRSAILYYSRNAVLNRAKAEYLMLIGVGIRDAAWQLRMQSLFVLGELPPALRAAQDPWVKKVVQPCLEDPVDEVRTQCLAVRGAVKGGA